MHGFDKLITPCADCLKEKNEEAAYRYKILNPKRSKVKDECFSEVKTCLI
jgi:hypothetical protein